MWTLLKSLLAKWAIFRILLKSLGSLAWLIPLAFLLKAIGIPALMMLGILAIPLLLILLVIGLPILLVVLVGGSLLGFTFWVLSIGLTILKLAIPIILVVWFLKWVWRSRHGEDPDAPKPADA